MQSSAESTFLKALFCALNDKGIVYAVARRMPSLPLSLDGSDLDIMTQSMDDLEKLFAEVKTVATQNSGGVTTLFKGDYATFGSARAIVASLAGRTDKGCWWGLHIDMYVGADFHGLPYMSVKMLMDERHLVDGAYWCLGGLSDVSNFVKEILHNGRMKKNYRELAQIAYSQDRTSARHALVPYFGREVQYIEKILFGLGSADDFSRARRILRRSLVRNAGFWTVLGCRGANIFFRLMRLFSPPGFFVAVLGTDGSGKTTLINAVTPFLERMTHLKVDYHHLRPGLLPSLSRLVGKPQAKGPVTAPHGGKPAGRVSSLVRFSYYLLDYTIGYFLKIYLAKVKRSAIIISDRWYYEYLIDPRRCAVQLPACLPRLVALFIPKPNLILCLGGAPEKIYARKPETSLEEVRRQVAALRKFCDGNPRAVWIDTTTTLESSVDAALSAILARLRARVRAIRVNP